MSNRLDLGPAVTIPGQTTGVTVELNDPPDAADMVTKMLVSDYPY